MPRARLTPARGVLASAVTLDHHGKGGPMVKRLAVATALAAVSLGLLASPAGAATSCSQLFCYQFGANSATVWTNLGPLGGSVTVQSPVWGILPLAP